MNLKQILSIGALGFFLGCEPQAQNFPMQAEAMPTSNNQQTESKYVKNQRIKNYLEGEVIQEVNALRITNGLQTVPPYPYAFTLKDSEGRFWTFYANQNEFLGFDSRIDKGDKIRIHSTYSDGDTIYKSSEIEVLEKAQ